MTVSNILIQSLLTHFIYIQIYNHQRATTKIEKIKCREDKYLTVLCEYAPKVPIQCTGQYASKCKANNLKTNFMNAILNICNKKHQLELFWKCRRIPLKWTILNLSECLSGQNCFYSISMSVTIQSTKHPYLLSIFFTSFHLPLFHIIFFFN